MKPHLLSATLLAMPFSFALAFASQPPWQTIEVCEDLQFTHTYQIFNGGEPQSQSITDCVQIAELAGAQGSGRFVLTHLWWKWDEASTNNPTEFYLMNRQKMLEELEQANAYIDQKLYEIYQGQNLSPEDKFTILIEMSFVNRALRSLNYPDLE